MDVLVAILALVLSGFLLTPWLVYYPQLLWPVAVGWLLRCALGTIQGLGLVRLPESQADARVFEEQAMLWSQLPWREYLEVFNPGQSFVYSWVGAAFYRLVGHNPLVLYALNIFLGSLLIILTWQLARLFAPARVALRSAWVAALFPLAVLYSAVLLREMFIVVPLMAGLLFTAQWVQQGRLGQLTAAAASFAVGAVFHGGIAIALAGLALVCLRESMGEFSRALRHGWIRFRHLLSGALAGGMLLAVVGYVLLGGMQLSAVGHTADSLAYGVGEAVATQADARTDGGSAYPDMIAGLSLSNPLLAMPIILLYFLFSPFPWDIASPTHLFGLLSNGMFLLLAVGLYRSRSLIAGNRAMQAVLIIALLLIIIFAFGTYNVGTAVRHREKLFFALLALCAVPWLRSRLIWRWR